MYEGARILLPGMKVLGYYYQVCMKVLAILLPGMYEGAIAMFIFISTQIKDLIVQ